MRVPSASGPRLQRFIDTFRHSQKYTPEYGAPVDGIPVQIGDHHGHRLADRHCHSRRLSAAAGGAIG
jgi:hypothetical protein